MCKPLYNTSCQGLKKDDPESCATLDQAKVSYQIGIPPNRTPGMERMSGFKNLCTMSMECPKGSQALRWPWAVQPFAWCIQEGPNTGEWWGGMNWLLRVEMPMDLKCTKDGPKWEEFPGDYGEEGPEENSEGAELETSGDGENGPEQPFIDFE
uniref:Ricin B-type lectin domain-containing protein n=1 Tax=Caenorhabditis tropicalis TaxID=1561998 RepID=A0A1I7TUR9_9PELO